MPLLPNEVADLSSLYDHWEKLDSSERATFETLIRRERSAEFSAHFEAVIQAHAAADDNAKQTDGSRSASAPTIGLSVGISDAMRNEALALDEDELVIEKTASQLSAGVRVGPYELQHELGRGGMGVVWLAKRADGQHERQIALKMPIAGELGWLIKARFARERAILASLEHPGIARLYETGVDDTGQPYIALEYVPGQPIHHYVRSHALKPDAIVRLFIKVLDAVSHAHAQLVIHRDIKPTNILVDAKGEPHLLDFGIAKLLDSDDGETADATQLTRESGRALTLDYASPEQINSAPLGTASDIYALGVVLFELLTGSRPYFPKGPTRRDLEQAILEQEPPRPSDHLLTTTRKSTHGTSNSASGNAKASRQLRGDLDTIVLKALKKQTHQRYNTAQAFADDLKRYLAYEPIRAKPDSGWYSFKKFVRRNRVVVTGSTALVASLLVGLVGTMWQATRAEEAAAFAVREARRANEEAAGKEREAVRANAAAGEAILQSKYAQEAIQQATASLYTAEQARIKEARAARAAQVAERLARTSASEATQQRDEASRQTSTAQNEAKRATAINDFLSDIFLSNTMYQVDVGGAQQRRAIDLLFAGAEKIQSNLIDQPTARKKILAQISEVLSGLGDHSRAVTIAKTLFASTSDTTIDERAERFEAGLNLALIYADMRQYEDHFSVRAKIDPYVAEIVTLRPDLLPHYHYVRGKGLLLTEKREGLLDMERSVLSSKRYIDKSAKMRLRYLLAAGFLSATYARLDRYTEADSILAEAIGFATPFADDIPQYMAYLHTTRSQNHTAAGRYAAANAANMAARKYLERVNAPDSPRWRGIYAEYATNSGVLGNWRKAEEYAEETLRRYSDKDRELDHFSIMRIYMALARAIGGEWAKQCGEIRLVFREAEGKPLYRVLLRNSALQTVTLCSRPTLETDHHAFSRELATQITNSKDLFGTQSNSLDNLGRHIAESAIDLLEARTQSTYERLHVVLKERLTDPKKSHPLWASVIPWFGLAASELGKHGECINATQQEIADIESDEDIRQRLPLFVPLLRTLALCQMKSGDLKNSAISIQRAIRLQEEIESPHGNSMRYSRAIAAEIAEKLSK
jgi:serine/threonine protein kinase